MRFNIYLELQQQVMLLTRAFVGFLEKCAVNKERLVLLEIVSSVDVDEPVRFDSHPLASDMPQSYF